MDKLTIKYMNWRDFLFYIGSSGYNLVSRWGYLGLFFVSAMGTSTIFIPVPTFIFVFSFGAVLNPFFVAFFSAIGSALGELTGYFVGLGGKKLLEKKYRNQIKKVKKTFNKYGADVWLIIAAATPVPNDILTIFCGLIKYDWKRFLIDMFIGYFILCLILAYGGHYSINWVLDFIQPRLGV